MLERLNRSQIRLPWNGLVAIAGCLCLIHIILDFQRQSYGHLSISVLFWMAIASLISDRRKLLKLGSNSFSVALGIVILSGLVYLAISSPNGRILAFFPLISAIGLALLASGISQIGQYRQELIGLLCLGLPKLVSLKTFDISPITARFTTLLLWYTGFPVRRDGIQITLPPTGGIRVVPDCSGLNLMLYMFGVSVIFLMLFSASRRNRILFPLLAMALGFFLNGIRVALLAFLSAANHQQAFDYWHSEEGALFFVLMSVGLFSLLCWLLLGIRRRG